MSSAPNGSGLAATLDRLGAIDDPTIGDAVGTLREIVTGLSNDVAALNLDELISQTIPKAIADLETTVTETAAAVDRIMDATEKVDCGASEATMDIYEACSFQDITGQRMTNVSTALESVRSRVDGLLAALDGRIDGTVGSAAPSAATEAHDGRRNDLLNGPQLPGAGSSQDDVDALLAEFDSKV